ncbi:MAG: hypothetical protein WA766_17685 [Candidatus Acidiferrales bacterium]
MSHDPHNRYLLELIETTLKVIERITRRLDHDVEEDRETLRLIQRELRTIVKELQPPALILATSISFQENSMNPTQAGQSQVFTGTLAPAGSILAPDAAVTVTSNDPAVQPTLDSTNLIVSVTYPAGWTESTTIPLAFVYTSASISTGQTLTATITPSAPPPPPPVLATSIGFAQTT